MSADERHRRFSVFFSVWMLKKCFISGAMFKVKNIWFFLSLWFLKHFDNLCNLFHPTISLIESKAFWFLISTCNDDSQPIPSVTAKLWLLENNFFVFLPRLIRLVFAINWREIEVQSLRNCLKCSSSFVRLSFMELTPLSKSLRLGLPSWMDDGHEKFVSGFDAVVCLCCVCWVPRYDARS